MEKEISFVLNVILNNAFFKSTLLNASVFAEIFL